MSIWKNKNESAFVDGKKHWTDVIKNSGPEDAIIWKQPEEDFNTNSTLIVMPGESAVFVKDGMIESVFENGKYTLSTENYPFISRLRNAFSGGVSTFNCVVYFVKTAHTEELKWGTDSPLQVRDKMLGIATTVKARGIYKIRIDNPGMFLTKLIGSNVILRTQTEFDRYFSAEFQSKIKSSLTKALLELDSEILGIESRLDELSESIKPQIQNIVEEYGLSCPQFVISAMDIDDDELRRHYDTTGIESMDRVRFAQAEKAARPLEAEGDAAAIAALGDDWARLQAAGILKDLANNPGAGGIASAGAGLGMGLSAGNAFGNMAQQMFEPMTKSNDNTSTKNQMSPSGRFVQKKEENAQQQEDNDPVVVMQKLKEMHEMGLISEDEFEQKKKDVLDKMLKGLSDV